MAGRVSLLWNAMRLLIDVGLHTRQMTPDAAVDLLLNRLPIDHQTAMCEVRWACTRPALQSAAALGRREILRLRETWRARSGEGATLRKFHDEFFSYGTLPVSLIEWGMGLDA